MLNNRELVYFFQLHFSLFFEILGMYQYLAPLSWENGIQSHFQVKSNCFCKGLLGNSYTDHLNNWSKSDVIRTKAQTIFNIYIHIHPNKVRI